MKILCDCMSLRDILVKMAPKDIEKIKHEPLKDFLQKTRRRERNRAKKSASLLKKRTLENGKRTIAKTCMVDIPLPKQVPVVESTNQATFIKPELLSDNTISEDRKITPKKSEFIEEFELS
mmetsp:Transcript_31394/g.27740  ORF Transcript_31394/g.27740 Transcript_31394/m.27740 type:complete len:121 (-) Transcript_31394:95-457(-)